MQDFELVDVALLCDFFFIVLCPLYRLKTPRDGRAASPQIASKVQPSQPQKCHIPYYH